MEQETKRCPYCGEEILAVAKKCKHCGEWQDEYNQNSQQKGTTDDHIDSYNDDDNYGNGNDHNHKESIIFKVVYKMFYYVGIGYIILCYILHHFYDVIIFNGWVAGIGCTVFGIMTLYYIFKGDND